jgi:hypothetical protein
MTDENSKTKMTKQLKPHIPTREEFHKYAVQKIGAGDFCTDYPPKIPGSTAAKIESSIRWTEKLFTNPGQIWRWKLDSRY